MAVSSRTGEKGAEGQKDIYYSPQFISTSTHTRQWTGKQAITSFVLRSCGLCCLYLYILIYIDRYTNICRWFQIILLLPLKATKQLQEVFPRVQVNLLCGFFNLIYNPMWLMWHTRVFHTLWEILEIFEVPQSSTWLQNFNDLTSSQSWNWLDFTEGD